jgi:hypothetical protein
VPFWWKAFLLLLLQIFQVVRSGAVRLRYHIASAGVSGVAMLWDFANEQRCRSNAWKGFIEVVLRYRGKGLFLVT